MIVSLKKDVKIKIYTYDCRIKVYKKRYEN